MDSPWLDLLLAVFLQASPAPEAGATHGNGASAFFREASSRSAMAASLAWTEWCLLRRLKSAKQEQREPGLAPMRSPDPWQPGITRFGRHRDNTWVRDGRQIIRDLSDGYTNRNVGDREAATCAAVLRSVFDPDSDAKCDNYHTSGRNQIVVRLLLARATAVALELALESEEGRTADVLLMSPEDLLQEPDWLVAFDEARALEKRELAQQLEAGRSARENVKALENKFSEHSKNNQIKQDKTEGLVKELEQEKQELVKELEQKKQELEVAQQTGTSTIRLVLVGACGLLVGAIIMWLMKLQ